MSTGYWPVLPMQAKTGYKLFEMTDEVVKQITASNNFIFTYHVCSVCERKVTFSKGNYLRFSYNYMSDELPSPEYSNDDLNFWLSRLKIQLIHTNRYSFTPIGLLALCSEQCLDLQTLQQGEDSNDSTFLF